MANPLLDAALAELHSAGVRSPIVSASGKHKQVRWTAPNGRERLVTLAGTTGDCRAVDNARADVRRLLRADGLLAAAPERRPERELSRLDKLERRLQRLEQFAGLQASNA